MSKTKRKANISERICMNIEEIRKHIEWSVTHIAREHGVQDDVVWKQMFVASADKFKTKKAIFV